MVYGAWWRTLQMRSLLVFADLAHPASWPNAHPSPCYFFQGYTIFPKPAEQVLLLFNEKHQISPFSFSAYGFFLIFFLISGEQRNMRQQHPLPLVPSTLQPSILLCSQQGQSAGGHVMVLHITPSLLTSSRDPASTSEQQVTP